MAETFQQFLVTLRTVDSVAAWKTISIAVTGAFGILGLLTEFRDKHSRKITRWGWVSLLGIIISAVFGIGAQLKESTDNSAKNLELVTRANQTLDGINRALHPMGDVQFQILYEIPCNDLLFTEFCAYVRGPHHRLTPAGFNDIGRRLTKWPDIPIFFDLEFHRFGPGEQPPSSYPHHNASLYFWFEIQDTRSIEKSEPGVYINSQFDTRQKNIYLEFIFLLGVPNSPDGTITSLLDFHDLSMILHSPLEEKGCIPKRFSFKDKGGLTVEGEKFEKLEIGGIAEYWYHFH